MTRLLAPLPVTSPPESGLGEGLFSPKWRRVAVLYVALTLPLVALVGSQADGRVAYLRVLVFVAGGTYALPALTVAWLRVRRVPSSDRWRWQLWFAGLLLTFAIGEGILIGLHTSSWPANRVGPPAVAVATVMLLGVAMGLVRTRSGRLALSVDLIECAMVLVVVAAPGVLLWGDDIVSATHSWYALPAAIATLGSLAGFYWTTVLYVRLRPRRLRQPRDRRDLRDGRDGREPRPAGSSGDAAHPRRPLEITGVLIGLALTFLGTVDGAAQVAQGVTGFSLPSGPPVVVHAMCMGMLLLFPVFLPLQISPGYHRLPPQAQVRGAGLAPLLTLAGLPVLLAVTLVTMAEAEGRDWVPMFSLAVVALLALLAGLRQLAGVHETRRLYALVEKASAERRELLARLIRQMSNDRHTVAAQLHEQAEALRQLMLSIRPMAMGRSPSDSLGPPIQAYLDSLYGDTPTPALDVTVDEDVVLDWITETIVSRIVQEAVHNVWRHSSATQITVTIHAVNGQVELRVTDDGSGFDPKANLFESGIATMRSFAAFTNGSLDVESAPGAGTTVVARLGEPAPPRPPAPGPRGAHLHLVPTAGT